MARFEAARPAPLDEVIAQADRLMYENKRAKKRARYEDFELPRVA
jgi:hypothetical protein